MRAPDLGIVVVSYNTRDDLRNCLSSIFRSQQDCALKVWVVDNNSSDGSAEMVASEFPAVRLIANSENIGFSRSNNLAIREMETPFVLLLNPDTVVSDRVFDTTIAFLRQNQTAGMVTCKLVKADGTLDLACRRSFPSAFDGFCRAVGLAELYPKSKLFARYNLTYLHEDEPAEVDAINGAFMMLRREALLQVGLLDEEFFMYMEDLDWCYRFRQCGWKIFYDPTTSVIHLKGQSGKKTSSKMIRAFFESMELFCRKHYLHMQGRPWYVATIFGIRLWKHTTLFRNALRPEKRVTP